MLWVIVVILRPCLVMYASLVIGRECLVTLMRGGKLVKKFEINIIKP